MARKRRHRHPARWRKLLAATADPSQLDRTELAPRTLVRWAVHNAKRLDREKQVAFLVDAIAKLTPRLARMCHSRDPAVQSEGARLEGELEVALNELQGSESSIEQVDGTRTRSPEQLLLGSDRLEHRGKSRKDTRR